MTQRSDSELVRAVAEGDWESFTQLSRKYYPALVAIAHSIIGDRDIAEDAAQQTLAKVVRKLPQLKEPDKFASWLAAICRNTAKDLAQAHEKLDTGRDLSGIAADSKRDPAADAVRSAIGNLPEADREIIFMRFYDGLSYEKMSAMLGISEEAVNGRLRRAKQKIAEYLRQEGFNEV